ncbi:AMP-binding protein [Pseudohongiella sp. O18]|uniref:AMP-binding protein n=1 Tax=Pseudohongiella sp. O18 TaxID=2904248 RepID=UPI001F30A887|nr:AMP-binding protein [Pseudohongiella sp. O18]|tara:strand:- start:8358 stop:10019 length:1662 start_codon:yes stop_codon:yes gene_type:complete
MFTAPALETSGDMNASRFSTITDVFEYAFSSHADKQAFQCLGHTLTYADLDRYSARLAGWLQQHSGLKPGDRIAIQLPNLLQFPVAVMAAARAGLVIVNTNPLYTAREMKHQFTDSGVKGIIILENFCHNLEKILPETDISCVITTRLADMLPQPKKTIVNFVVKRVKRMVPAWNIASARSWDQVMKESSGSFSSVSSGTDVAIVLYTGGTTGLAKGAMLTHQNLIVNMMQLRQVSKALIKDGRDTIVAPLPLYHTYAFMFHCMAAVYAGNLNVLIPNPRDINELIKTLQALPEINGFVGLNTLFLAMCRHKDIAQVDFSKMRFTGSGGMALTISVAEEWAKVTGCQIYEGYGLTECSPVVSVNPHDKVKIGTVGPPVPGTDVMTVDEEGNDTGFNEKGELWIRGPQVMKGYWQNEKATTESITAEGWFKTGDFAQIDEEGYIRIVDRKKDLIIVSGFNVFPSEVEEVVNAHPGVAESAAIGVPSDKSGETIKLFVVRRDSVLNIKDVESYCRENLTAYKVPKQIEFVDDLPKSNVGKILRRELREQELNKSG